MLQQTRVAAVLAYYQRFLEELPTVSDLASCPDDRLMKLWQGLGYYRRARNLQKAAQQIIDRHNGMFPTCYQDIRALAGVGDYTAGAISSIAFGLPEPAVDGNVLRVTSRLTGDRRDVTRPQTKAAVTAALRRVIPLNAPGVFNQALMDLGAMVCLPNGAPICEKCPAASFCTACRDSLTSQLPVKAPKKARKVEERTVYLIFRNGAVALRRREPGGLLAGLWEYPGEVSPWPCPVPGKAELCGVGRHIFTHIEWHMTAYVIQAETGILPAGWVWADREELVRDYAIPSAFRAFTPVVEKNLPPVSRRREKE